MAFSSLLTSIEPYVDIRFNVWFTIILTFTYVCALRKPGLLLLVVLGVSPTILLFNTTGNFGEMTKTMILLPFGLGPVLAFLVANRSLQTRYLSAFTTYINYAVYANIGIMVGTPPGGTLRGWCSKITCIAIFVWIVKQGHRAGWKTVRLHNNLFVFTAVSKSWIFAHAAYRFILLTLPAFGSGRRHRLLELYSLTLTFALSSATKLPFEHLFGMADTLVVPAIAGWSAIATTFNLVPRDKVNDELLSNRIGFGKGADVFLSALSLSIAAFVCYKIASTPRRDS